MIIDQLPEISTVQETDEIPVERGTATYKSTLQKIKALVASLLTKTDVGLGNVDNVRQYSAENSPILTLTVTGTTDSNAYLESGLLSANNVFLGATNVILNGTRFRPIMVTPLFDGGSSGNVISLRIANYAGDITQFKNASISMTVFYMKV